MTNLQGRILNGKYLFKRELGSGAMGVVWLAEHVDIHKLFAIKCLSLSLMRDPAIQERFRQEGRNQSRPGNPAYLVNTTDFFEEDGQYYLVMEYVEGEDLGRKIRSAGRLSPTVALRILRNVLQGLAAAHAKGLVHRDIKPSNIMIDESGVAKVTDFGIALAAGETRLTKHADTPVGTSWYMSPEQIQEPKDVSARSDIYAAGIVLYEMLTGRVPYSGESDFVIERQHVESPAPDPRKVVSSIPRSVAALVSKATAKKPGARYQSCGEFLEELDRVEAGLHKEKGKTKRALVYILLLAGVVASVLMGAYYYYVSQTDGYEQAQAGDIALVLVQTASEKGASICRDLRELEPKRRNMEVSESIQEWGIAESYRRQIGEIEENVRANNVQYAELVKRLGQLQREVVQEAFTRYNSLLEEKQLLEQLGILKTVLAPHYEQVAADSARETMVTQELCSVQPPSTVRVPHNK